MQFFNFLIFFNITVLLGSDQFYYCEDVYFHFVSMVFNNNSDSYICFPIKDDKWLASDNLGFDSSVKNSLKNLSNHEKDRVVFQNNALMNFNNKKIFFPSLFNFSMTCKPWYSQFKDKYEEKVKELWFLKRSLLPFKFEIQIQEDFFGLTSLTGLCLNIDKVFDNKTFCDEVQSSTSTYSPVENLLNVFCCAQKVKEDCNDQNIAKGFELKGFELEYTYFIMLALSHYTYIFPKNIDVKNLIDDINKIAEKINDLNFIHKINEIKKFNAEMQKKDINENKKEYEEFPIFIPFKKFILTKFKENYSGYSGFSSKIFSQSNNEKEMIIFYCFLLKKFLLSMDFKKELSKFYSSRENSNLIELQKVYCAFLGSCLSSIKLFFKKKYNNLSDAFFNLVSRNNLLDYDFELLCRTFFEKRFSFSMNLLEQCDVKDFFLFFNYRDLTLLGWHFHWFCDEPVYRMKVISSHSDRYSEITIEHYKEIIIQFKSFINNISKDLYEKSPNELINIMNKTSIFTILSFYYTELSDKVKNDIIDNEKNYEEIRKLMMGPPPNSIDLISNNQEINERLNQLNNKKQHKKKIIYGVIFSLVTFCFISYIYYLKCLN